MPDDLLRFVVGPTPYSAWWLWIALALLIAVIAWYVGVFVWTLPSHRLRRLPVIRTWHATLLRRRFTRAIDSIAEQYRNGDLPDTQAAARMTRTLRSFLHQATGTPAQYMHVDAIASSDLATAAPLFSALNDAQFGVGSPVQIGEAGSTVKELIRTWP